MTDIGTILTKKISIKYLLVTLAVLAISILSLIYWGINNSINMDEYKAIKKRCGSGGVVAGYTYVDGNGFHYYYESKDSSKSQGPVESGHYFCTDEEAEAAGYELSQ